MASLEHQIEAVLFYKGEPETRERLAKLLEVSDTELNGAVDQLAASLSSRGIQLLTVGEQLELVTSPETSDVVTKMRKEELVRDLGKAGAETLSVILYRGPVTRAELEYIRGVNCSFILRNLLIRGLVEKTSDPKNDRTVRYSPTPMLLKHLGVTKVKDLPEYDTIAAEISAFENQTDEEEHAQTARSTMKSAHEQ